MNKFIVAALLVAIIAGCGIEWFPEDKVSSDPNKNVSFSVVNACTVAAGTTVNSQPIAVFGLVSSASISVSGDPSSAYSFDGSTFVKTDGTIKPGQNVTLQHTTPASTTTGSGITMTTLTIAGKSATWKTSINACSQGTANL
jgi:hypothetical protein